MSAFLFFGAAASLGLWATLLLLPWQPWRTRETLDASGPAPDTELSDVCVLIPARNEAEVIPLTLRALSEQGRDLRIVVVDDGSEDGTVEAVQNLELPDLTLVHVEGPPAGWSGKLWALEQGREHAARPLLLLLDADIALQPGTLAALRAKLRADDLAMVSLMAWLRMKTAWEKLLVPAFIFFFRLLYPFAWANSRVPGVAAAAGGCVLLKRDTLDEIGGFGSLRDALIDDCTLAARIKSAGHRTWVGLTHSAHSLRQADGLRPLWNMVARSAFTQLRYNSLLLLLVTAVMLIAFALPPAAVAFGQQPARLAGAGALLAMAAAYLPTLTYYRRSWSWALLLPLTGLLYLAMTWSSAVRYWRGERSRWKGRSYRMDGGTAS